MVIDPATSSGTSSGASAAGSGAEIVADCVAASSRFHSAGVGITTVIGFPLGQNTPAVKDLARIFAKSRCSHATMKIFLCLVSGV